MIYDLCIHGAWAMDPETGLDSIVNIGIHDGTIQALCGEPLEAMQTVEGQGLVAAPGFIDLDTHEDTVATPGEIALPLFTADCTLKSGCTTIVGGNCGISNLPIGTYRQALQKAKLPLHCYTLVGNLTLREAVGLDLEDQPTQNQIDVMTALAHQALGEGALGISFGLQSSPGTGREEILALCQVAKQHGAFAALHLRYNTPDRAMEALDEALEVARSTGVALHLSHLTANIYGGDHIARASKRIRDSKLDVTCDVYPYTVWTALIHSHSFDEGFERFLFDVGDLEILNGRFAGRRCTPDLFERLRRSPEEITVACHNAIPNKDVENALKLPFACVGSSAQASRAFSGFQGHPRTAGTPARFISEYARKKNLFPLMEAIRKLTLMPANRCGLIKKGRLQLGCDADLVLFDPENIRDRSSYGPNLCVVPPAGIACVIVDGRIAWRA